MLGMGPASERSAVSKNLLPTRTETNSQIISSANHVRCDEDLIDRINRIRDCALGTNSQLFRAKSSILFQSAGVSWSFAAAMFSSRCASDDVPGMGNMTGDFCSNQARASCTTLTL